METLAYEISRWTSLYMPLLGLVGSPLVISLPYLGADPGTSPRMAAIALGVGLAGYIIHTLFLYVYRIELDDGGLTLVARAYTIDVPWQTLISVSRISPGPYSRLAWRRYGERSIRTSDAFAGLHELLAEVQSRAPHVQVTT